MPSEFLIGRVAAGLVVRIVGRGTMQESLAFRAAVERSLDGSLVVFDAAACDYLDSTFLGCLVWAHKACEHVGTCQFVIAAPQAARNKLFSASSLDHYFSFVEASPEPLDDLVTIGIEKLDPKELGLHVMHCHELLADMGGSQARAFRAVADQLAKELSKNADTQIYEAPNRPAQLS